MHRRKLDAQNCCRIPTHVQCGAKCQELCAGRGKDYFLTHDIQNVHVANCIVGATYKDYLSLFEAVWYFPPQ